MPDLQPDSQATVPAAVVDAASRAFEDEYALGFECADPSLQIEAWGQQLAQAAEPHRH